MSWPSPVKSAQTQRTGPLNASGLPAEYRREGSSEKNEIIFPTESINPASASLYYKTRYRRAALAIVTGRRACSNRMMQKDQNHSFHHRSNGGSIRRALKAIRHRQLSDAEKAALWQRIQANVPLARQQIIWWPVKVLGAEFNVSAYADDEHSNMVP